MKQSNRGKRKETIIHGIFGVCGFLAVAFVALITIFLISAGLPAIGKIGLGNFLLGRRWASTAENPAYGILPFLLTTFYGTLGAIVLGVPVGVFCAVYLSKIANRTLSGVVRTAVELLAGIPSVVYGLVGMIFLVPLVRKAFGLPDGANLFTAILVLAVMILPTVIAMSETALRAVPKEYEEASLALGATKMETIVFVTLPAAKSGILASVVLGIGRAIGEAMAVMMVAGNVANMPHIFRSVRFLAGAVASEMAYSSGLQREALFSVALVLFVFIMLLNVLLHLLAKKERR